MSYYLTKLGEEEEWRKERSRQLSH